MSSLREGIKTGADMELDFIRQAVAKVLHVDEREIGGDTSFAADLGADSIDLCQIAAEAENRYGIRITEEDFSGILTLGELAALIRRKKTETEK